MRMRVQSLWTTLALCFISPSARAFSFTSAKPTQCDPISIAWTGGTLPFQLLLTPIFGTPRNVSIPATAFSGGQGTFTTQLPFPKDQKFFLTMSDSTGFGTGGSTDILVVGTSLGGSCNTTDPGPAYSFELNTVLQQCRPYVISGYDGAAQPVTIMGVIPGGKSFVLNPPVGSTSFSWNANVASGTSIAFIMTDAQGRSGGSSEIKTVGVSSDKTCLDGSSPSSTAGSSNPTSKTSSSSHGKATASASAAPSAFPTAIAKKPVGAIAGTILGVLIFLAVLVSLVLFLLRRRRSAWNDGSALSRNYSQRMRSEADITYDSHRTANVPPFPRFGTATSPGISPLLPTGPPYEPNSLVSPTIQSLSPSPSSYYPQSPSLSGAQADPFNPPHSPYAEQPRNREPLTADPFLVPSSDQSSSHNSVPTAQQKVTTAGSLDPAPSRFILHTDVDDALPPPNDHGVVELPPLYSERLTAQRSQRPITLESNIDDLSQPSQLPYLS